MLWINEIEMVNRIMAIIVEIDLMFLIMKAFRNCLKSSSFLLKIMNLD